ncbi:MAG TPA: Xaa-Pro peptidase family protein [Syntrophobacteraceae bacterium]|nr:Xaa-Pro peptidase family protein [Syntrophobacteraceae bacterium]
MRVPAGEIARRLVAFQELLSRSGIDAAIIRQNTDLYYFTGTVQDAHLIVPASGRPLFMVRRDPERALSQSSLRPIHPLRSIRALPAAVREACGTESPRVLGLELDVLPANTFFFYDEKLFPKQQIRDVSGLIRRVRMIKSPWELEMMQGAAGLSRTVSDAVPRFLREGISELELSIELEAVARRAGHLGLIRLRGFNMDMYFGHVLSGPEAAVPAYSDTATGGLGLSPAFGQGPSLRVIRAREVVSVDTMMNYHGYLNDQTRNFCIGEPPERLQKAYTFVREVHRRFREIARPGSVCAELYHKVCEWAEAEGWTEYFMGYGEDRVSFVGHGLGLEVDELPLIARGQETILEAGMTFAFEPKIILPGTGIAGLENTYVVDPDGLRSLNTAPEDLMLL